MKRLAIFVFALLVSIGSAFAGYCPQCRFYNDDRARYCSSCGAPLAPPQEFVYCPDCGFQNPYGAAYCGGCRHELHAGAPHAQPIYGPHPKHKQQGWRTVGNVTARNEKGAQELPGAGPIHRVKIRGIDGSIIINTVVVREGGEATHFPVTTRFSPGQEVVKDLPREFNSTGFRLSKEGNGSVEVSVQ